MRIYDFILYVPVLLVVQFEQPHQTTAYKLSNLKMAKRLWKLAVEHHAFFR